MALPGTEPFSMSCESPKMEESSLSEIARALGDRPRKPREANSLVTNDSSSSFKRNGVERRFGSIGDLVVSCRTAECKLASGYLSTLVDRDVEPCDDFYQHVCGKWTRERDGLSFLGDAFQRYLADLRRRLTSLDVERATVHPKLRAGLIVGSRFVRDCFLYMEEAEPDVKREVASILEVLDVSAVLGSESSFDALLQALTLSFTTGLATVVGIRRRRSEGRVFLHIHSARSIREELLPEATDPQTARIFSQSPDDDDAWLHVADLIGDPGFPAGLWDVAFGSFKANEPVRGHDNAVLFTGLNASRLVARHLERTLVNVTAWYLVTATLSRALRLDFVKRFGVNYPYR
ncbi:hypothetical protein HPB49_021582 [Dermacentor silvarum]|uniref:Uncharacterized protein n=1 Tax=Dermacentor silvarum TaxID=543639 RepID=A0ACB8C5F8_DERSI|nr:hypothetical protein HPB49_021582 [Dermacentor silvarum]